MVYGSPMAHGLKHLNCINELMIADSHKHFIFEHDGALAAVVQCLLADDTEPRREIDGAEELQEYAAHILNQLAQSDQGLAQLRASPSQSGGGSGFVVHSLQVLLKQLPLSAPGGRETRRHVEAALFRLENPALEATSHLTRTTTMSPAAAGGTAAASAAADGGGGAASPEKTLSAPEQSPEKNSGHVMLSYNWSHQTVVVRLAAVLGGSYRVWIDIEKMCGATVDTMALAVEQAECMIFCISPQYKESANW